MKSTLVYISALAVLSACSSVKEIGIQTYKPAAVTFPSSVQKVLVLNNAVPQGPDEAYQVVVPEGYKKNKPAVADSALLKAGLSLAESLANRSFFKDVRIYEGPFRKDTASMLTPKLTPEEVNTLCVANGTDAIITLSQLRFSQTKAVINPEGFYYIGDIDLKMSGLLRVYLPDRETPLAAIYLKDSLQWEETGQSPKELEYYLPSPTEAMVYGMDYLLDKTTSNFVPYWEDEVRWYYTGQGRHWKKGAAYAANNKWDEAEQEWEGLYKASKEWKGQARAASNLALAKEMQGAFSLAFDWAYKAYNLYKENEGVESKDVQLMKIYATSLRMRMQENKKLSMQLKDK